MNPYEELLCGYLNEKLVRIILSNPRSKGAVRKVEVRPVMMKGRLYFQAAAYTEKQVQHHNLTAEQVPEQIRQWMEEMRQFELLHKDGRVHVLVSKKGKMTVKRSVNGCDQPQRDLSHNRKKQYILDPEVKVPFLVDLGVQTEEGRIVRSRYDKFKQINRFLEFIRDVVPELPRDHEITIVDFGCGKSYLTFATYYYLHELEGLDVRIIGLDLKEEVIRHCSALAEQYGYEKLSFLTGDIADYEGTGPVDMVVTLHACDTATDFALQKAVQWQAKVILSVPCCQHELNKQISNELLEPVFKYGLLKERMAALITDGIRANLLEQQGYQVQVLEFIDMEHTPKNILLRGIRDGKRRDGADAEALIEALHADPMLWELLKTEPDASE